MLSKRLAAVAKHITNAPLIVDVGTDHALLPLYIVEHELAPRVIGIELNEGPYQAAKSNVKAWGLEDRVEVLKGDGLEPVLDKQLDTVVIAGMGGKAIINILKRNLADLHSLNKLILQPMTDSEAIRHFIIDQDWYLADEDLVLENDRLYEILVAKPGQSPEIDDMLLEVGPILMEKQHPLLPKLLERKIERYFKIANSLENSSRVYTRQKIKYYLAKANYLEKVLVACQ